MVKPNEVLQIARAELGLTEHEAAAKVGINSPSYYDLEAHEDELFMVYSTEEMFNICRVLKIHPVALFDTPDNSEACSFDLVSQRLKERCYAINDDELERLENSIGWDIKPLLSNGYALLNYPVDAVKNICRATNTDWRGVVINLFEAWSKQSEDSEGLSK